VSNNIHQQKIIILDFGSQYTQLIARRIRQLHVYCEIHPFDLTAEQLQALSPQGVVLSGGPESVTLEQPPQVDPKVFTLGVPVLGICYGMQTMAAQLGGQVDAHDKREFGPAQVRLTQDSKIMSFLLDLESSNVINTWMSHGDRVTQLPPGFSTVATSENSPIAMMADESRNFYGLQFHPEVTHTEYGDKILQHFVQDICQCEALWTPNNIIEDATQHIRELVGDEEVILALSGGVDSSVVAALLHKAIGDQLSCVFVNNGLLRLNEAEQVMSALAANLGVKVTLVDAQEQFIQALHKVADPEQKRKIIGKVFIDIFQAQAKKQRDVRWLAQGTIYPDVIESAASKTGKAQVIKSHHNVGGLPEKMHLQLIEPLRELFKDEVRQVGLALGLPRELVYRHPFPGPGLAVRILGEVTQEAAEILRQADHIFIQALRENNLYDQVSQAFAVFMPIKSVGVVGDARQYEYVIALRAVTTEDFMTAHWAKLPYEFLEKVSNRIVNEVKQVSRVVYDISSKPPATIEWE
jgi:GMP synthase (glutamine-hydrolysing)